MNTQAAGTFIEGYRSTFESMVVQAIVEGFTFPCQADGVSVTTVPDAAAWTASIARIAGAYRLLGVVTAAVESLRVVEVTPGIAHAIVHWHLLQVAGTEVYGFTASYTLVDTSAGPRIAGVAHDEGPKLQRALAAAGSGRPA